MHLRNLPGILVFFFPLIVFFGGLGEGIGGVLDHQQKERMACRTVATKKVKQELDNQYEKVCGKVLAFLFRRFVRVRDGHLPTLQRS